MIILAIMIIFVIVTILGTIDMIRQIKNHDN